MAKRLNRLLAALAAAATLATCVSGAAWAETADGKVPLNVKAADGTTLDGAAISLYRVGEWNMDSLEYDEDGRVTNVHATSTDDDDRSGFTVDENGERTEKAADGGAAKAARTAGIDVDDARDPLDAAWQLGAKDSHTAAFARAYAKSLTDGRSKADATLTGAGTARVEPGVYIAMRDDDADTAALAGTQTADGSSIDGLGMGEAVLTGDAKGGATGLLSQARSGIMSLLARYGIAVADVGGSAGVNGYGGGGGSGLEWRWWFQDTPNRDGDAKAVAYRWGGWNKTNWSRISNDFDSTCDSAKRNAMARYGHEYGYYRIVAVGAFIGNSTVGGGKTTYHGSPGNNALRNAFWTAWNAGGKNEMQARTSDRNGYLSYVAALADEADGGRARIACVVLGRDRPSYSFGVSMETQAQSTDGAQAAVGKYNYVNGGRVEGTAHTNYGGIEHDQVWVRDQIDMTATEADANFTDVVIETHLKVDENGDHKPDHEQVITEPWNVTVPKGKTISFWTKPFWASQLSNWGKPYWPKGHLWFDTWVKCAPGKSCGLKQEYHHYGDGNAKEEWYRTPTTLELSTKASPESGSPTAGGSQRIRDRVSITPRDDWWLPDEKATLKSWLHYDADGDGTADKNSKMKTFEFSVTGQGWAIDSTHVLDTAWYEPSDLGMKTWRPGTYWFDAAVDAFTENDAPILSKTYWDHVGKDDSAERFVVSMNAFDLKLSTKAAASTATANGTQKVRDSITLSNSGKVAAHVAKVTVTLNYPGANGTVTASKTTGAVSVPAGGTATVVSPDFAPSDLGFANGWHANIRGADRYWFDVKVDPADVTDEAGNAVTLTTSPSHDGKTDESEQFFIPYTESSYSTKAADTFAWSGGTGKVHDDITLDFDEVPTLNVTSTLNWSADTSATKATSSKSKSAALPANATSAGPSFSPSDLGMTTWKAGRYWYDLTIPSQIGNPILLRLSGLILNQSAERWIAAEKKTGAFTTRTDAPRGMTDLSDTPVHDVVTATTTGYPAGTTFDASLKLSHAPAGATTADRSKTLAFKVASDKNTTSPAFTPAMFGWKTWKVGRYWFDLTVTMDGKAVNVPGADDPNERFDVSNHTVRATLAIATQADRGGAATSNGEPVRDTVTLSATGGALDVARMHVRLNYPKADGTTATAVKDTGSVTVPKGGSKTIVSPDFTPADLGLGDLWADNATASDRYWFDAWVDKADVTLSGDTGILDLTGTLSHEGKADKAEQFRLDRQTGKATTTATDTFAQPGGTGRAHDTLHLFFPGVKTLNVTSTLSYAADATATKADSSKARTATVMANGDQVGPAFTPSDFGWKTWKAGRYWYDLTIPAQSGYGELTVSGLADKAEQWTAANTFRLDIAKRAYIGKPGEGSWSNEPVKGATFTVTETTDQTGTTPVAGAKAATVTTDANGSARLVEDSIGATSTRWFKVVETAAPASYEKPGPGSYWMIRVTGSPDGATVTMTGSDQTAQALLKGVNGSTATIGNRLEGNIVPPLTGGSYDVMRAMTMAGIVALAVLICGVIWTRRRRTRPMHAR